MEKNNHDKPPVGSARKVAIVGGGPSRVKAPFKDPNWDIWAFSSHRWRPPRITRWYEIHAMPDLRQQLATKKEGRRSFKEYMRFMKSLKCPVYMHSEMKKIPGSIAFPLNDVLDRFGRCFTSTAAYLIAQAILEGYTTIGLWGINPKSGSYKRQRGAIEYLLGMARKEGIKIVLPKRCSIRVPSRPKFPRTKVLYAYDWKSPGAWWRDRVRHRLRKTKRKPKRKAKRAVQTAWRYRKAVRRTRRRARLSRRKAR